MKCKYFKIRTKTIKKKRTIYNYCTLLKKEVALTCYKDCSKKEYKQYKVLKSRSNKLAKKEKERFSIIYSDLTKCCYCGSKRNVAKNEVYEGAYRQRSMKLGMIAPFCTKCHDRFHNDIMFNLHYKVLFENEFLKTHELEEFIKIFGQDYIFKLEHKKRGKDI